MLRGFSGETRSTTIVNNLMTGKGHVKDYFVKSFTFLEGYESQKNVDMTGYLRWLPSIVSGKVPGIPTPYKALNSGFLG